MTVGLMAIVWLQSAVLVSSLVSQYISKAPVHKSPAPRPLNED